MSSPIYSAIKQICEEKNISEQSVIETIEAALAAAYRKDFGHKNQNIKVKFEPKTGQAEVYDFKIVVEKPAIIEPEEKDVTQEEIKPEEGQEEKIDEEQEEAKFNPKLHLTIEEAVAFKEDAKIGDEIKISLEVPAGYGRMAAQTAKQVIIQKLREAERDTLYNSFKTKEHELLTGTVQRRDRRLVLIDLGRLTAILPPEEQIERERYHQGDRLKVYVVVVNQTAKGPEVIVSRSHEEIIRELFFLEIPEIANGLVEIKGIAREAGSRSKIAVFSCQENIDPIGSCIGQRGTRVQTIINELGGEKIDIIEYNDDPDKFIVNALSPAKIESIKINEKERCAVVMVKEDQLSLAIGKAGQNVRLAAKLTGWRIDIQGADGAVVKSKLTTEEEGKQEEVKNIEEGLEEKELVKVDKEKKNEEEEKEEKIKTKEEGTKAVEENNDKKKDEKKKNKKESD